jgi:C1A family cysteine protease
MKFILAALATIASATMLDDSEFRFMEYISTHAKSYDSADEYALRFNFWSITDKFIASHNADSTQTHIVGHNFLSDMTPLEKKSLLGFKKTEGTKKNVKYFTDVMSNDDSINWVDNGAVTPVKDQAACGSCWSFSATGALEGAYQLSGNTLTAFSEQ